MAYVSDGHGRIPCAATATESLQLGLACRLFKTWQLEKRLLGLTLIKEAIGRLGPPPSATRSIAGGEMLVGAGGTEPSSHRSAVVKPVCRETRFKHG